MRMASQELSNGLLGFNNCTKIKSVPVPFAYVQLNALLLLTFACITPIAVACFTVNVSLSVIISVSIVGGFGGIWLVTNELEERPCRVIRAVASTVHANLE